MDDLASEISGILDRLDQDWATARYWCCGKRNREYQSMVRALDRIDRAVEQAKAGSGGDQ